MIGIDQEVQSKVDAYRGNPNALAQKYSQNQQLIDLLALQKLKSEKESAAREMQLKMGGQQMPTIAEARENEVLDLTKQELAQNTTGAMQQQQAQKQQAAKQLVEQTAQMPMQSQSPMMQGVAGLPANNITPKAMAGGGIVAFSGEDESYVDAATGNSEATQRYIASEMRDREREAARREEIRQRFLQQAAPQLAGRGPADNIPETEPGPTTAPDAPIGIPRTTPRPAPAPQQRQAAPQGQPGIAGIDPRAIAMRDEIAKYIGFTPEERARREGAMADREKFDRERYSPEQQRSEALTRFLLGGAGRSGIGSIMAGAGAASENYKSGMREGERGRMVDRQKQMDELIVADVGTRKTAFDLGLKSAIDYAQIAAKQAANALGRESMDQNRVLAVLSSLQGRYTDAVKQVDTLYNNEVKNLGIFGNPTPAQKQALEAAEIKRQLGIREISNRLQPAIRQAEIKAGVPSASAGFTLQSVTPARPNP